MRKVRNAYVPNFHKLRERAYDRFVFRNIIGCLTYCRSEFFKFFAALVGDDDTDTRRTWIPPRTSVGINNKSVHCVIELRQFAVALPVSNRMLTFPSSQRG